MGKVFEKDEELKELITKKMELDLELEKEAEELAKPPQPEHDISIDLEDDFEL